MKVTSSVEAIDTQIRVLDSTEVDNVSGGNPYVLVAAGFLLEEMTSKLLEEAGAYKAIDVSALLSKGKGKQKPA